MSSKTPLVFIAAILLVVAFFGASLAQVHFSKDWGPGGGKRSSSVLDAKNALKTATNICHILIEEIRQLNACEALNNEDLL